MKKGLFFLFILLSCFATTYADNNTALWQKANNFYQQKQYDSAANVYESLALSKPANAELYYNLGNTYYRLNNIGRAVLNYERALQIDPSYKDAKENLILTQNRIPNRITSTPDIFFVSWWHSLTTGSKATGWAITCLIIFLAIIIIMLANRFMHSKIPPQAVAILSVILVAFLIVAFTAAGNAKDSGKAVVMRNEVPFTTAQKSKMEVLVPEGTTVELKSERNGMAEVRLPDGRTGTMAANTLAKI
jgi:tetratricopeptide (TPR) repeat protein